MHRLLPPALVAALLLAGCTSTVTPPAEVGDPVTVALVQDARHVGLVLPRGEEAGGFVEFGFGDWGWYVEERDAWYDVFGTVLVPTQGALGRASRPVASLGELRRRNRHWIVREFPVDRRAADELLVRLETTFRGAATTPTWQPRYRFEFVPSVDSYWAAWTCADVVADWCRELGCSVGWAPIRIALDVTPTAP